MKTIFNFRFSFFFLLTLLFVSCGTKDTIPPYQVVKEKKSENYNRVEINIELEKAITTEELTKIANDIRSSRTNYDQMFVFYRIKGISLDELPWATTHFSPELKVEIMGTEATLEQKLILSAKAVTGDVIGKWYAGGSIGASFVLLKDNEIIKLLSFAKDNYTSDDQMKFSKAGGVDVYSYANPDKDYYLQIMPDGNAKFMTTKSELLFDANKIE